MPQEFILEVNGQARRVACEPDTPLLYVLRDDLGLKGVKYGCGSEQCGACKALVDGQAVPTCKLPLKNVAGLSITTIEGLSQSDDLHPLQQAFIEEQALQCGFCTPGMIIAAQGLLNQNRYPSDEEIRTALESNLCRCGVYDRVRRAIKLRIGRLDPHPKVIVHNNLKSLSNLSAPRSLTELPNALVENQNLDDWVRFNTDGTITLFTGKVELGQGIKTAVALIGAEELDISLERIQVATTDSSYSPNEGLTVGSMSMETTGEAMRFAAAEARQVLLSIAFEELEAPIDSLLVEDGTILDPYSGRSTTYWQLMGGRKFGRQVKGVGRPKSHTQYRLLGESNSRLDVPEKVEGAPTYIQDLDLPGMVHGRVLRPPHYAARLKFLDENTVSQMPGVLQIVRDGDFLGVICEHEVQAVKALDRLQKSATWSGDLGLPDQDSLFEHMLAQPSQSFLVEEGMPIEGVIPPFEIPPEAEHTLNATYNRPFHMHASLGPSAAAALFEDEKLTLWVQSQGVYPIRAAVADVLGMAEDDVRVIHVEGAGCYGHNGADDAALDAALLARALPGRPVSLKWMRADEHTWEPYGPAMVMKLQASLGEDGTVIDWNHDVWSYPHLGRSRVGSRSSGLLAAWHLGEPFAQAPPNPEMAPHVGGHRNADPKYAFPRRRIVKHFIPDSPLRVSALRGLGAFANVFAIESFMDELAHHAGIDPLEFRLRHLKDERAKAVISAAGEKAGWGSNEGDENRGQGLAFAQYKNRQCYAAVVVDLAVDPRSGEIKLEKAVIAADAGQIVSADGLSNQLEGSFVQAASWTLYEQVRFDRQGITSRDWDSYPLLRFPQAPKIETVLLNRPGLPFLGSGEAAQGPTPAAIANAIFDAVRVRLREIPFALKRVKAALNSHKSG